MIALGSSGLLGMAAGTGLAACADAGAGVGDDPPSCEQGEAIRTCYSRDVMEGWTAGSCQGFRPLGSPPSPEVPLLANGCLPAAAVCDSCCNRSVREGEPNGDGSCCYWHCDTGACCGRPLLVAGRQRLAGVTPRTDWLGRDLERVGQAELAADLSPRIAAEWIEDARMEHASIAAFARFTLELLSFAAPSELVAEATRAAQDELAHARACFSIARRFDPCALGPAGLDMTGLTPSSSLHDAVRTTFLEGCVGETQAALIARHAADVAHDPALRETLAMIADDEARHAELAFRFVAWALRVDPSLEAVIRDTLAHALRSGPAAGSESDAAGTIASLHAAGRLTATERAAAAAAALSTVIAPCTEALLAASAEAIDRGPPRLTV